MNNKDKQASLYFEKIMSELDKGDVDAVALKYQKHIDAFSQRYPEYFEGVLQKAIEVRKKGK